MTGGISRAVGGLCALDAGAEVCGMRPVRTIGGWRRVEIATACQLMDGAVRLETLPFCPDSFNPCQCVDVSNEPPIECIELAVDPRLGWYLPLEPGLALSVSPWPAKTGRRQTDLGKGYSFRDGAGDIGERALDREPRS